MKIIVLGGAGEMGSRAAEDLAGAEGVTHVTILDKNETAAKKVAEAIKDKGASVDTRTVNAFDHASMVETMRGYNVVASALGPFNVFEPRLISAALDAGANYCSICDEWEPAETVITRFHDLAKGKGLTMITGLGASPGITNMGVLELARKMDKVDRVQIAVYLPINCGARGAALRHGLYIMTGEMALWRNGARVTIKACTKKQAVEYPRFGYIDSWNMGHSEPITLPRYLPGLKDVDFYMGFGPGTGAIAQLARWNGFAGERRAEFWARAVEITEKLFADPRPGEGASRIDIWGEKNGEPYHGIRCGMGLMRETTGLSLAAGAYLLGKRDLTIEQGGVYAPEGCLKPESFFYYLHRRGIDAFEDLAMTKPVILSSATNFP